MKYKDAKRGAGREAKSSSSFWETGRDTGFINSGKLIFLRNHLCLC